MWAGMLHLAVLNVGIGILEGTVLARLFKLPKPRAQAAMIPANYLSAFAGFLLLRWLWTPLMHLRPDLPPLLKAGPLLVGLIVASFILSVVLEWPFCAWAMRENALGWKASLRASTIAQAASYALLIPFYLLVSPISLLTTAHLETNLNFVTAPGATVFYINPQDGGVWRIQTDGTQKRKVLEGNLHDLNTRLFLRPHPKSSQYEKSGQYDLYEVHRVPYVEGAKELQDTRLMPSIGTGCAPSWSAHQTGTEAETWFNFGRPADLRAANKREWTVWTEFWANGGITVERGKSSNDWEKTQLYTLAFETPFADWICRNATILPSNQVVFQLGSGPGDEQIVILDMAQKKLGFLTMGQGPVVVLEPT